MRTLDKREKRALQERFPQIAIEKKSVVQFDEQRSAYLLDSRCILIEVEGVPIPFLGRPDLLTSYPTAIIDMPAVAHITNGADLLRPGIVDLGRFGEDAIIIVRDEKNRAGLAVMRALFDSSRIQEMEKGKVAKNLHYVGDRYWKMLV